MTRHYIVGNGPSVTHDLLLSLNDGKVWGVNRIWKMWDPQWGRADFIWRPHFYVRCEVPKYRLEDVMEDLVKMGDSTAKCFVQEGFKGILDGRVLGKLKHPTSITTFSTCGGKEQHEWHMGPGRSLDLLPAICGYGTVVNVACQLAVLEGATEIVFVGCDLTQPQHFYGSEGANNNALARRAHEVAARCCPVPIYDGGVGALTMYPRLV